MNETDTESTSTNTIMLILLVVGQVFQLLLGIFQSIQANHFKSDCCRGFCSLENVMIGQDAKK